MKPIYARKVIDENGHEVIELDLNKPWPRKEDRYGVPVNQLYKMNERMTKKPQKEFITLMN